MDAYLRILKKNRFKITPLRKAILNIFQKQRATLTAEALCRKVRRRIPNAGLQSVYRNMADFVKAGIAEEMFLEKRKAAFALCNGVSAHHHHAVCRRCGRSEEVEACRFEAVTRSGGRFFKSLKHRIGFKVERHFLQLEGLCRACQNK